MSSARVAPLTIALMLLSAACSSTARITGGVAEAEQLVAGVEAPKELRPVESAPSTNAGGDPVRAVDGPPAQASGPSQVEVAFVTSTPSSGPSLAATSPAAIHTGPGVSGGTIRIGIPLWTREPALFNQLEYEETFRPRFKRVWDIVIGAINSTGGILGRRVQPVYLGVDPTAEEICTYFTEEQPVVAVVGMEKGAASCLDDRGVVPLSYAYTLGKEDYGTAPHLLTPTTISHERAVKVYIDGLYAQNFFEGDRKIGLVRWDTPRYARLSNEILKPALARHGYELTEELAIVDPKTNEQVAQAIAEGRSGVQRFKTLGIDRVLILDVGSYILPHFSQFAEQQDYHPRYGLNSLNGGEWEVTRNQLKGAVGVGWMPWLDLEPADAYRHGSEGARRCKDLMDASGAGDEMDTYNEALWTSSICDGALFLKAAIEAGGPDITADSIVHGAESLSNSFQASNTLMTRFAPGRHEGVAAVRFLRWFVKCQCFRYTSGLLDAG